MNFVSVRRAKAAGRGAGRHASKATSQPKRRRTQSSGDRVASDAPLGQIAVALLERWRANHAGGVLFLSESERRAEQLGSILHAFEPECGVMVLPRWDSLPYDGTIPSREVLGRRASVLRRLAQAAAPPLVLTTAEAALHRVPPRSVWKDAVLVLRPNMPVSEDALAEFFARTGYSLEARVEMPGEASIRGQVIDIFPAGALGPVRLEYTDGRISALASYDPETQLTDGELDEVVLDPASEIVHPECPKHAADARVFSLAKHYGKLATLFDYVREAEIIADARASARTRAWLQQTQEAYEACQAGLIPGLCDRAALEPPSRIFLDQDGWDSALAAHKLTYLSASPQANDTLVPKFATAASPARAFQSFIQNQIAADNRVVLTAAKDRDLHSLERRARAPDSNKATPVASLAEAFAAPAGAILRMRVDLDRGFLLPERQIVVVAAADLLGSRAIHEVPMGLRDMGPRFASETLRPGDVIVHRERGVGILRGLETVSGENIPDCDMIELEYADQKTVLAPVQELASIWKYTSETQAVTLDRIDGSTWTERRRALEREIAQSADQLVAVARERECRAAPKLVPPAAEYERFASQFPYFLTPDQARAIQDVLEDLASGHPMDRLVCGDVGFGKTEVALRAAAAAVLGGKQVVIAVPTTVLARQHVTTFRRRFARFGIEVGHLSRFATPAKRREVKKALADGSIRIVVGTHAVAAKGVRFHDLGLVVIDEEQRFGVSDKAKLRQLGEAVHVLTMSATPIPRTLRLATVGLHSLSILATPPARRLPVRTVVGPWDPATVGQALRYEHRRGGQSFLVCPRIEDIDPLRDTLRQLVPELEILVLHGRMPVQTIDETMMQFADGKGDVLLTTNIVESGLDIPRANTMLVSRADRFGLAQLHQLRGRVGRANRRAFAYLWLDPKTKNPAQSAKRLQVLEKETGLGSGFAISQRDMDLRGYGNLLSEQQAGHLKLLGPELYSHLFERAVRRVRGEPLLDEELAELHIEVAGSIPLEYVGDEVVRLELYSRIAKATDERALDALEDELEDRFGPAPRPVRDLIGIAKLRLTCSSLRITRVDAGPRGIAMTFREPRFGPTGKQRELHWHDNRLVYEIRTTPDERLAIISRVLAGLNERPRASG